MRSNALYKMDLLLAARMLNEDDMGETKFTAAYEAELGDACFISEDSSQLFHSCFVPGSCISV